MNFTALFLTSFICLASFEASFGASVAAPLKIMIDPGHGGIDSGAVRGSVREADIALAVSLYLRDMLKADPVFEPLMTRTSNKNVALSQRVNLAEKAKADLLISIHVNANKDPKARGVELYFQNHLPPDEETMYLASIENRGPKGESEVSADLEPTKRNDVSSIIEDLRRHQSMLASHKLSIDVLSGWKSEDVSIHQAPFYVISRATFPSLLVELGFLTNSREAERLQNPAFQKESAAKIYQGLTEFARHRADARMPAP